MTVENGILSYVFEEDLKLLKENPTKFWAGVSCIDAGAFCYLNLESIEIPDTVTKIEERAFDSCSLLKNIKLPKHLKTISSQTFRKCKTLESVQMPENLEIIEKQAFEGCPLLNEIKIPSTVKKIEASAFCGCLNLKEITLPEGLECIDVDTFQRTGLTEITIPKNVVSINNRAFANCSNLNKINFSKDCKGLYIGYDAFINCDYISRLELPEDVVLAEGCFNGCLVDELVIGEISEDLNLTTSNLKFTKLKIREGVTQIKRYQFKDSNMLQEVKLPSTLQDIGTGAFAGCFSLKEINLPEGIKEIPQDAFNACEELKNVIIPESVEEIGIGSFLCCNNLETIKLPENLRELHSKAFMNCHALKQIEIPKKLTVIESETFKNCENLRSVTIPSRVIYLGPETFYGCANLNTINLPDSVTSIGADCFSKTAISTFKFPDSLKNLGEGAFNGCRELREVILSENIKEIPRETFKNCEKLTNIEIPNSVTKIGGFAFGNCSSLKNVKINRNVKIDSYAFYGSEMKYVTINKDEYIFSKTKEQDVKGITLPYVFYEMLVRNGFFEDFIKNCDIKMFNNEMKPFQRMLDESSHESLFAFYKFALSLGCFSTENLRDKHGKELEATKGQKRSSLLASIMSSGALNLYEINEMFNKIKPTTQFSDNVVKFLSNTNNKEYININLLKRLEKDNPEITYKVVTDFETAKAGRTTINPETGMPQTLSWEKALINFYQNRIYEGIDDENRDLAVVFKRKNIEQIEFDEADLIRRKAKAKDMPHHILGKPLKEDTLLGIIEKTKNQTSVMLNENKILLSDLYDKKFTYEMLDKYDPHNAIIGLFTSCCATITSEAYGGDIARATMRENDVQNIIIRDINGEIISKGTLYVNKKNGYIVINDFEINDQFKKDKTEIPGQYDSGSDSQFEKDRDLIFKAFMRGIHSFVNEYDKQNPSNPIKQVNVGLGYNRLKNQCMKYVKATEMLEVPEDYNFNDAMGMQYILYDRKNELKINKNKNQNEIDFNKNC